MAKRMIGGVTDRHYRNQISKKIRIEAEPADRPPPTFAICDNIDAQECSLVVEEKEQEIEFEFSLDEYLFEGKGDDEYPVFDLYEAPENPDNVFEDGLREVLNRVHTTYNGQREILKFLKANGHPSLPLSVETFQKRSKEKIVLRDCQPGQYWHNGIETCITIAGISPNVSAVVIDFSVDGVPLVKSSRLCLWPILGRVIGDAQNKPFLIGCYAGYGSFTSSDDFLADFVHEAHRLQREGVAVDETGSKKPFQLRALIADSPARAAVACIKYPTAFNGCGKCTQVGKRVLNTNTFTKSCEHIAQRTDQSFELRLDKDHHNAEYLHKQSALEKIGFGMVSQIPVDPMHLVDLGVTKSIFSIMLNNKSKLFFESSADLHIMEQIFLSYIPFVPSDMGRHPRPFNEFPRFKGNELRQLSCYTGPIVLRDFLKPEIYEHFLLYHCAIRLLHTANGDPQKCTLADDWLKKFVNQFAEYYGENKVGYNVHNLLHLAACCVQFGNLQDFSAYPYENFLQEIKGCIRKPSQVLQQIRNSINDGRLGGGKNLFCNTINLNLTQKNNHCLLIDASVVRVEGIEKDILFGRKYLTQTNFFDSPCESKYLSIYYVENLDDELVVFPPSGVQAKLFCIPYQSGFVVEPLLHHE